MVIKPILIDIRPVAATRLIYRRRIESTGLINVAAVIIAIYSVISQSRSSLVPGGRRIPTPPTTAITPRTSVSILGLVAPLGSACRIGKTLLVGCGVVVVAILSGTAIVKIAVLSKIDVIVVAALTGYSLRTGLAAAI